MKTFYVQWKSTLTGHSGFYKIEAPHYLEAIQEARRTFAPYIEVLGVVEGTSVDVIISDLNDYE